MVQELRCFSFLCCLEQANPCFSPLTLHSLIHFSHVSILIYSHSPVSIQNTSVKLFSCCGIFDHDIVFPGSLFEFPPLHCIKNTFFLHFQGPSQPRPCLCSTKMAAPSYPWQMWAVQAPCSFRSVSLSKFPKPFDFPSSNPTLKFLWYIWQAWRCWAAVVLRPGPTAEAGGSFCSPICLHLLLSTGSSLGTDHTSVPWW